MTAFEAETRVSVVIPVGGVDPHLGRQVEAVLRQHLDEPFEVVLSVNSAATDVRASVQTVRDRFADVRVRTIDSSDRRGAAHARNVGAQQAMGEMIAFCDSDDLVHQGWLAALIGGLAGHDAVCGRVVDVYPDPKMAAWRPPATEGDLPRFLGVAYLLSGNMAIRRAWFDKVGGFDETLTRCEDIAIGWSLIRRGASLGYVADAVLDYHHRPGAWPMLKQHYLYGKGMAEVLSRDGVPSSDGWSAPGGLKMLKPNGQRAARRTVMGTLRRVALGLGRVSGMAEHRLKRRNAR